MALIRPHPSAAPQSHVECRVHPVIPEVLAGLALLLAGSGASGQSASVSGRVIDQNTRTGIAGAEVRVTGFNISTTASGIGAFTIGGLTPGVHVIEFRAAGYATRSDSVTVTVELRM